MNKAEVVSKRKHLKSTDAIHSEKYKKKSPINAGSKIRSKSPYEVLSSAKIQRLQKNIQHQDYLSPENAELFGTQQIDNRLEKFIKSLEQNKVPKGIIETYKDQISSLSSQKAFKFIVIEQEGLDRKNSQLISSLQAVKSWEDSLSTIREMCEYLSENPNWVKLKDVVKECAESLSTHILLTINMIEMVKTWKNHMRSVNISSDKPVSFYYKNSDIFMEVRESCDFLVETSIAVLFPLIKSDPFLNAITKELTSENQKSSKDKSIHKIYMEKGKAYILLPKEVIVETIKLQQEIMKNDDSSSLPSTNMILGNTLPIIQNKSKTINENKQISQLFSEKFIFEIISIILEEVVNEVIIDHFAQSILSKYLTIVNDITKDIAKTTVMEVQNAVSSEKAKKFHNANLIEGILRNLIEYEISHFNIKAMCEEILDSEIKEKSKHIRNPEAQKRLSRISKNMEFERLAEIIYIYLLEEFVSEEWIELLAISSIGISKKKSLMINTKINNKNVEEVEDYALEVFTPGVHSPNEVKSDNGSLVSEEDKNLDYTSFMRKSSFVLINNDDKDPENLDENSIALNKNIKTLKNCKTQLIKENEENFMELYIEYTSNLPEEYQNFILDYYQLEDEVEKANNPKYFWLTVEEKISGLIIYSLRDYFTIVHHVSFMNFSLYGDLLMNLSNIVKFNTQSFVYQFKDPSLNPVVIKFLKKKNFEHDQSVSHITEYKTKDQKSHDTFSDPLILLVNAYTLLETSHSCSSNNKLPREMIEVGNRHCLISNLLSTFLSKTSSLEINDEISIRLQRDVNEMLEILLSLDFLKYPLIHNFPNILPDEAKKICHEHNFDHIYTGKGQVSLSILPIKLDISGCSFVTHIIDNIKYKYLRFRSKKIFIQKGESGTDMYILQTNNPHINIFFIKSPDLTQELIQGMKYGKTDLFYNIDNLIKALRPIDMFYEELWVPCFMKMIEWGIPWIEGFKVDSENCDFVISGCHESVLVELDYKCEENKSFVCIQNMQHVMKETFVFGVFHEEVKEKLESPMFVALIKPEEWIRFV
ncbi:hypothetical protein SteCoe_11673 [Stentor coeruleus]|uniref:Cyclic nucleotide-binding domain-containing protein n=1 Tax=Stentor coeruleus TaxID=5963 RepID=A0A1R2CCK5_9CILI|nr:hypothetical protein SteCoe_11673 [Stentor coeruleus]